MLSLCPAVPAYQSIHHRRSLHASNVRTMFVVLKCFMYPDMTHLAVRYVKCVECRDARDLIGLAKSYMVWSYRAELSVTSGELVPPPLAHGGKEYELPVSGPSLATVALTARRTEGGDLTSAGRREDPACWDDYVGSRVSRYINLVCNTRIYLHISHSTCDETGWTGCSHTVERPYRPSPDLPTSTIVCGFIADTSQSICQGMSWPDLTSGRQSGPARPVFKMPALADERQEMHRQKSRDVPNLPASEVLPPDGPGT